MVGRSSAIRRLRRRSASANSGRLFCATNGCASFLDVDIDSGVARCHVCGFERTIARSH